MAMPDMAYKPNANYLAASPYQYPPLGSSSSLSLPHQEYNIASAEDSKLNLSQHPEGRIDPDSPEQKRVKKRFIHRELNTALGPLSIKMFLRKKYIKWYLALLVICVLVILMTVYHHDIVKWMEPKAQKLKDLPGGWSIPIGILFVISFPPLFGHEIVAILCGIIWGLWQGFGIVAAGTLLGELGTYFAFKWCCSARARKYEREDINYACMTRVIQEGGFKIVFLARLSAIPGHLTTAVFATCGLNFWSFFIATVLTLPKQLQVVYLGVVFNNETTDPKTKWISNTVLGLSFVVTIGAALYIYKQMAKWRPIVLEEKALKESGSIDDPFLAGNASDLDLLAQSSTKNYQSLEDGRYASSQQMSRDNSNESAASFSPSNSPISKRQAQEVVDHPYADPSLSVRPAMHQSRHPQSALEYVPPGPNSPVHQPHILVSAPPVLDRTYEQRNVARQPDTFQSHARYDESSNMRPYEAQGQSREQMIYNAYNFHGRSPSPSYVRQEEEDHYHESPSHFIVPSPPRTPSRQYR